MSVHAIGVDLSERGAVGVAIDAKGAILQRVAANGTADVGRLVRDLAGKERSAPVGVAADEPHRTPIAAADSNRAIHLTNPGMAAITAEAWVGAAQGARHAICLSVGDRVFAGLLLDGAAWRGAHGLAGSAAWLALNPVERQDYRRFGSLAAEVSNQGIARRLSWRIQSGDQSTVLERAGTLDALTAQHVFDGARIGDGVAISVVRETAKYVGMAIANLASAIDPEVVVLAGDLASVADLLFDAVVQECSRRLPGALFGQLKLAVSPLGGDGVAVGAARLAAVASR